MNDWIQDALLGIIIAIFIIAIGEAIRNRGTLVEEEPATLTPWGYTIK